MVGVYMGVLEARGIYGRGIYGVFGGVYMGYIWSAGGVYTGFLALGVYTRGGVYTGFWGYI